MEKREEEGGEGGGGKVGNARTQASANIVCKK